MFVIQEMVDAEVSYRLERADRAALVAEARRTSTPWWQRLWSPRPPHRRMTPALP